MKRLWTKPAIGPCAWKYAAMDILLAEVAERHGLTAATLRGRERRKWPPILHPRQEAMFEVVAGTALSWGEIASRFGRDHTTIIHGVRAHCKRHGLELPRGMKPEGWKAWIEMMRAAA